MQNKSYLTLLLRKLVLCMIGVFALAAQALAQTSGKVSLFVRDEFTFNGVEANVAVLHNGKTTVYKTSDGGMLSLAPEPGRYDVMITAPGHRPIQTFFAVEADAPVKYEIILDRNEMPKSRKQALLSSTKANVCAIEGYVTDGATGKAVANALVRFDGKTAKTNAEGFFSLATTGVSNLSNDGKKQRRTSLVLKKEGFKEYEMPDFLLTQGTSLMKITLEKGTGKVSKGEHTRADLQEKTVENHFTGVIDRSEEMWKEWGDRYKHLDLLEKKGTTNLLGGPTSAKDVATLQGALRQSYLAPPTSIRVGTGCSCKSCGSVSVMSLESYVQSGLDNEWISSWNAQSLRSGAIAYRSYAAWHVRNPVSTSFDICSSTCCQVWNNTRTEPSTQAAAIYTSGFMIDNAGAVARAEYSAENNNQGCGNCYSGTGTSNGWPCISDDVCCGQTPAGHGRGMCQWGTQRWAANRSKNWRWITEHYYNPGNFDISSPLRATAITSSSASVTRGQAITFTVGIQNSAANSHSQILIKASLRNTSTGTLYANGAADAKVTATAGTANYTQNFTVSSTAPSGTYNAVVTLYFDVDENGSVSAEDLALHTFTGTTAISLSSDATAPTTSISVSSTTQADDFTATFTDADEAGGSGLDKSFYQVLDHNGTEWRANKNNGFFNDNFDNAIHPDWTISTGTWAINTGYLQQSNQTLLNTNIWAAVNQTLSNRYMYHWAAKIEGTGTNRRAGFHFFSSDASQTERANSYFIWYKVDTDEVLIYKTTNNTFGAAAKTFTYALNPAQWYDFKVIYDRISGKMDIYINNALLGSWTDPSPIATGSHVSFRSGECVYTINDFKVYRSRFSSQTISVGSAATNDVRYESVNSTTPACKIKSIVNDAAGNLSAIANQDVVIDWVTGTIATRNGGTEPSDLTLSESNGLYIYPNPVDESTTIGYKLDSREEVQLTLTDAQGRTIVLVKEAAEAGNYSLPLNVKKLGLSKGVHILHLTTAEKTSSVKFIVE